MKISNLKIFLIPVFCLSNCIFAASDNLAEVRIKTVVEHKSHDRNNGLFCKLCQIMEWIYCAEQNESLKLYINMFGIYGCDNLFTSLFKTSPHARIITDRADCGTIQVDQTPCYSIVPGYAGTNYIPDVDSRSVYGNSRFYTSSAFMPYRNRMNPIVMKYFQPVDIVQNKIDDVVQKMRHSDTGDQKNYVIGIHIRCTPHLLGYDKSQNQFMADLENDIDQLMRSRDPRTTKIFLATLLRPVVEMITAKYDNVIVSELPRSSDVVSDWYHVPNAHAFESAYNAIVDMWSLASCDEVWGGSSNMLVFVGCINPNVKIRLLPSIASYNGA